MYSEKTTLVGVKKNGDHLELMTPSNDLYVAAKSGEVLLQWQTHDEYDGVTTKYARLTEAFWDGNEGGNYSFKFDNGETYMDDGGVPASYETDEDEPAPSGGGSGGGSGVELVGFELEFSGGGTFTPIVDHTVAEIDAAREAGKLIIGVFGNPGQMAYVQYSGDDDYPYSVEFHIHAIEVSSLVVTMHGFYYEEGAWVYNKNTIEIQGAS